MTFEEFFKKKKINLLLLQQAEPLLFSEFETHYKEMGEKSFDHTKKYWFNKLRRLYVLPPEPKIEKIIIENKIAEQTIAGSLTEPVIEKPKVGFIPRFKAGSISTKPADISENDNKKETEPKEPVKPKVGFIPRFKAGATSTKVVDPSSEKIEEQPEPQEAPKPKVGFTPRFKSGTTNAKPQQPLPDQPEEESKPQEQPKPNVGFTPRFKPPQK